MRLFSETVNFLDTSVPHTVSAVWPALPLRLLRFCDLFIVSLVLFSDSPLIACFLPVVKPFHRSSFCDPAEFTWLALRPVWPCLSILSLCFPRC